MIATDASAAQVAAAVRHERVTYRVALAESSGLAPSSVDLITVAQALHWFDLPAFFREARRVLRPGGVIAAWCYKLLEIDDRIDAAVRRLAGETLGAYWSPERQLVETGYRTIDFPFEELHMPPITMEHDISLAQLVGYIRTWSATRRYVQQHGGDPVAPFVAEIEQLWGEPHAVRRARRPLWMRVGRTSTGRAANAD